jgi:hypothetical protein
MTGSLAVPLAAVVLIGLAACTGNAQSASPAPPSRIAATPIAVTSSPPPATPVPTISPAATPRCPTDALGTTVADALTVRATANIFGAGLDVPPGPAGGGTGTLPTLHELPAEATLVVFEGITGCVNPVSGQAPWNGPGGAMTGRTNVESFGGVSGVLHEMNTMFLVGVFATDQPPVAPAPERLDFSDGESFDELAPMIGQTFFIGDGVGRRYRIPGGATRLFLGFADAFAFVGPPGWYGNNSGELQVRVASE